MSLQKKIKKILDDEHININTYKRCLMAMFETTQNVRIKRILKMAHDGLSNKIYFQDGLMTIHNTEPLYEDDFMQAVKFGESKNILFRSYIVCNLAKKAIKLDGDFVECGVHRACLSGTIVKYLQFKKFKKNFFLMDTFSGFDYRYVSKNEEKTVAKKNRYPQNGIYEYVKNKFSDYPNVKIIKGSIPDTLPLVKTKKIAFLSIDMNCAYPSVCAINYFWNKLVSGGVIVCDDYAWQAHSEQREAIKNCVKKKGVEVLSLPTGQGLIFKP